MKHKIKICMGSACFARGNNENLEYIQKYLDTHNLREKVELTGARCENKCAKGPNITIDEKNYNEVTPEKIEEIMNGLFGE